MGVHSRISIKIIFFIIENSIHKKNHLNEVVFFITIQLNYLISLSAPYP